MKADIGGRVRRVGADIFGVPVERIGLDSSPDTIGNWDSLQHLNLTLALEQEFGLKITPEESGRFLSIRDIVDLVGEKLEAPRAV